MSKVDTVAPKGLCEGWWGQWSFTIRLRHPSFCAIEARSGFVQIESALLIFVVCGSVLFGEDPRASAYLQQSPFQKWFQLMVAGGAARGRDFRVANKYKSWMIEAGFVDVVEKVVFVPVNGWPVDIKDKWLGKWYNMDVLKFLDGSKKLLLAGGMPEDRVDGFLADVRRSSIDASLRSYCPREYYPLRSLSCTGRANIVQITLCTVGNPSSSSSQIVEVLRLDEQHRRHPPPPNPWVDEGKRNGMTALVTGSCRRRGSVNLGTTGPWLHLR